MEVRDARLPLCSACAHVEPHLKDRKRLIILNKCDLIEPREQHDWAAHFAKLGQAIEYVNAVKGTRISQLLPPALIQRGLVPSRDERSILIMIVGLPNTGKSSVINAMRKKGWLSSHRGASSHIAKVGAVPGITRAVTTIQFYNNPPSFLIDTPGLNMTGRIDSDLGVKLSMIGTVKEDLVDPCILAEHVLNLLNEKSQLEYVKKYGLSGTITDTGELLTMIAMKYGCLQKSASIQRGTSNPAVKPLNPDMGKAAHFFIQHFRAGELGRFVMDALP